jgi:antagonist of KipI
MNLRIIKAGLLDTVQDMGRYGYQHLGINPGGVMDRLSASIANILVGNDPGEAVIEMHFPASAFFFERPALIALAGAEFAATVNGEEVPRFRPIMVSKYSILQFHRAEQGTRAYLAIYGGMDVQPWLNSASTNLRAGVGGFHGRILQKDDEISLKNDFDFSGLIGKKEFDLLSWKTDDDWGDHTTAEILVLPGHEWTTLDAQTQAKFLEQSFLISPQSDRMGYQLRGEPLYQSIPEEVVSSAVNFGTIQLLPDGQLIVLMADHQTTGGYPRIAHVISAHHSRMGQLKPGDPLAFRMTDQQTAEELFTRQQQHLLQLRNACKFKLEELIHAGH